MKAGLLPRPVYINGIRAWAATDIALAEKRLREAPPRTFPPGSEQAGRDLGHELRDEFALLKQAAGDALAVAGVERVSTVLAKHAASGKLSDIPVQARRRATSDLRRLAATST